MARTRTANGTGPTPVEALTHEDKRSNIPTADAHDFVPPEIERPQQLLYPRDQTLDPQLVWKGKDDQTARTSPSPRRRSTSRRRSTRAS